MFATVSHFHPSLIFGGKANARIRLAPEVGLLDIKSDLRSTTKCDQIISVGIVNLVTPKAGAEHELLFSKLASALP